MWIQFTFPSRIKMFRRNTSRERSTFILAMLPLNWFLATNFQTQCTILRTDTSIHTGSGFYSHFKKPGLFRFLALNLPKTDTNSATCLLRISPLNSRTNDTRTRFLRAVDAAVLKKSLSQTLKATTFHYLLIVFYKLKGSLMLKVNFLRMFFIAQLDFGEPVANVKRLIKYVL